MLTKQPPMVVEKRSVLSIKENISTRIAALLLSVSLAIITLCFGTAEKITDPPLVQKVTLKVGVKTGGR